MKLFKTFGILYTILIVGSGICADNETKIIKLTLTGAVKRALVSNRGIRDSLDNLLNAQFSYISAKTEFQFKLFPTIYTGFSGSGGTGGGISISKKLPFGTSISFNPTAVKYEDGYNTAVDLSITQPLLKGLSTNYNRQALEQSRYGMRSAERGLYLTRNHAILATISAVYDIIRKQKVLQLQQSSFNRLKSYAEAAKIKQKKGHASALDVYRANIQLKQAKTLLTGSMEQFQDAKDNLKIILNMPLENDIRVFAPLDYTIEPIDEPGAIRAALKNRIELEQVRDMVANLELQKKTAKHNLLPQLDVELRYNSMGNDPQLLESFRKNKGSLEVRLETSGDVTRTNERMEFARSKLALKSVGRLLSLRSDEIKREVKHTLRSLNRLAQNIQIQKEQIHEAKGKLELSKVKFSHGMANNFDLIESEAQLRQAETAHISSIIDYIIGQYRLKSVMGSLLDEYGFKKNIIK